MVVSILMKNPGRNGITSYQELAGAISTMRMEQLRKKSGWSLDS